MGIRRHKGLAIVAGFLFLMGVVVPAAFGLMTEKAEQLGMAELLDKSTNWDSSNIANSTYFLSMDAVFDDNATGNAYAEDLVLDKDNDMHLVMADTSGKVVSSVSTQSDYLEIRYVLNKSAILDRVDKIVVLFRVQDAAGKQFSNVRVRVTDVANWNDYIFERWYNDSSKFVNGTLRVEIPLDAIKKLRISGYSGDVRVVVGISGKDLDNVIVGSKVELYNVKKVNTTAAANMMLTVSGILGWVGAFAATPFWNPISNPRHRDVRRVVRRVRRIRRRR